MAAYFNLNNNKISQELLVSKFNMILDNQCRLVLNDQNQRITSPHNKPQRSPEFVQKQPPELFRRKKCSLKFRKFYRKTPVLESLFNNKRLQHWRFPVRFPKVLRTRILKNSCERLLQFVLSQTSIANNSGKFGLDETSIECRV